jgi:hypothetical protein
LDTKLCTVLNPHSKYAVAREIIAWHVFFESMFKQPRAHLNVWLANWCFDDDGVFLLDVPMKPDNNLRRKLENAIIALDVLESQSNRTIH